VITLAGTATTTAAVAAAANQVYQVADKAFEHATFLTQDGAGDTLVWFWGSTAGAANGTIAQATLAQGADSGHLHAVAVADLTLVATLVGVTPSSLTAASLA
jgi:hypothetical protein